MDRLLDTKEVAMLLGKSTWWVRVNRETLGIPAFRIGSKLRFRETEVLRWLEESCRLPDFVPEKRAGGNPDKTPQKA